MTCHEELLKKLDTAVEAQYFPGWDCGESIAVVGLMRASGFNSKKGAALTFESFERSLKENVIQCQAFCYATYEISQWNQTIDTVFLHLDRSDGKVVIDFGGADIPSRGKKLQISFEKKELVNKGYLKNSAKNLTSDALLLKICDTFARDDLFGTTKELIEAFELPKDAERIFIVDQWEHPTLVQLYEDGILPSKFADLQAMAQAACDKIEHPVISKKTNTSWHQQCKGGLSNE